MKMKVNLLAASCLFSGAMHSMDLSRPTTSDASASIIALLFNNKSPADVLKNGRSFAQERDEQFGMLTKVLNPRVTTFIQDNPHNTTAQGVNRALNLVASKMAYFIGEDAPVLNQDPLSQNPHGNPIAALFNQSARTSRDTMVLLLPMEYFLNREEYLNKTLGERADIFHRAFLRSIEQVGASHQEMMYIREGRPLSEEETDKLKSGSDILQTYSSKADFFTSFRKNIKKEKLTDLIDEMADVRTALILSKQDKLKEMREQATKENFGTSQDAALSILTAEQNGCSLTDAGGFSFDMHNELQTMTYAIADHKNDILSKLHTIISTMQTDAVQFQINDVDLKKGFLDQLEETKEYIERAQERTKKLEFALATDAKLIGPRTYALCNLYGTFKNLSSKPQDPKARTLVNESMGMYHFVRMNE